MSIGDIEISQSHINKFQNPVNQINKVPIQSQDEFEGTVKQLLTKNSSYGNDEKQIQSKGSYQIEEDQYEFVDDLDELEQMEEESGIMNKVKGAIEQFFVKDIDKL